MPKEQINTPARRLVGWMREDDGSLSTTQWFTGWAQDGDVLHDGEHWENTPVVFVGWSNHDRLGDSLQISVSVDAEEILRMAKNIEHNRALGLEGAGVTVPDQYEFSTIVMSRPEAQKLIRTAKRARDAVFGADE